MQVASTLFAIPAVDGLYFGPDFITVTRVRTAQFSAAVAWEEGLKQQIVAHLEVFCEEQEQQLHIKEAERLDSSAHFDDPTEALIVDIIETQVESPTLLFHFHLRTVPCFFHAALSIYFLTVLSFPQPKQVRAVVQEDGGNIIFKRWDPVCGTVWVLMEGACVGCTMSKDTLHNGVLRLLQHYVPEVQAVCELTSVPVPAPPETLVTQ